MTGHILRVPCHEIRRESAGEKFCFECRQRTHHSFVVMAPDDIMSYYGPHWKYECERCKGDHVDFPGTMTERGWADEQ